MSHHEEGQSLLVMIVWPVLLRQICDEEDMDVCVPHCCHKLLLENNANGVDVAKTEHSHPLGMVVSTHFRCGKGVKRGLKNGALPFNID